MEAIISSAVTEHEKGEAFTAYVIELNQGGTKWIVKKRYSDFDTLHTTLSKYYGSKLLPKMPPKIVFGKMKKENIDKRRLGLQMYLTALLENDTTFDCDEVRAFLEVDSHISKHERVRQSTRPPQQQEQVRALFTYETQDDSELAFVQGDVIVVLEKDFKSGWWYGYRAHEHGKFGFFPSNFVEGGAAAVATTASGSSGVGSSDTDAQADGSLDNIPVLCTAEVLFDYDADGEGEMSIKKGDRLQIFEQKDGWCLSRNERNSDRGWIPETYVTITRA